jgi:hypothetical protein
VLGPATVSSSLHLGACHPGYRKCQCWSQVASHSFLCKCGWQQGSVHRRGEFQEVTCNWLETEANA